VTDEASETTRGESQDNDDVEHTDVNTELERVCCNYSEQLARKCFTLDPTTILDSIKFGVWVGYGVLPGVYTLNVPCVNVRALTKESTDKPPLYAMTFSRISSRPSAVKSARITFIACESTRSIQTRSL